MRMSRFYVFKKLRVQIALHYIVASVLTLLFIGIILYFSIASIVQKEATTNTENAVEQSGMYIDLYIDRLKALSRLLAENPQLVDYFSSTDRQQADKEKILSMIDTSIATDPFIESIVMVSKDGQIISNESGLSMSMSSNMMKEAWYVSAIDNGNVPVLTSARMQDFSMDKDNWVISLSREIKNEQGRNIGVLLIDVQYKVIEDYLENLDLGHAGFSFILNANHEVVYHEDPAYFQNEIKQQELYEIALDPAAYDQTEQTFTHLYSLRNADWIFAGVSSQDELTAIKNKLFNIFVLFGFGFLIIATVSVVLFTGRITTPFRKLERAMQDIEKGLTEIKVDSRGCYEAQSLSRHFNGMMMEIRKLMQEITDKEKDLRRLEISTLHSQINPHFLYNTLDTIVWMAEFNDSEKVIEMTKALAQFFRLSLSGGNELTTVENELDHVRQYLFIQKERYGDGLVYTIDCDPSLLRVQMPKIILQPIVENALYHGIRGLDRQGVIEVRAETDGDQVIFTVRDNGEGFDKDLLVQNRVNQSTKLGGVGIKNVDERIQLYYGPKYGVNIHSDHNGTTVRIVISKTLD
ncbi:histidine kinase [Paenibacillus sp. J45TS6]|uniref:sensor histidine kinase n=1 Tax=unclassified Paenibacillus TaxID=185978 RepID=UPI001B0F1F64|nr:sensor histidine kinase [Paenibacillus sp. J45TS6]GIP42469.1 histidine kinase [Paenibacillus sp. J45TS6]